MIDQETLGAALAYTNKAIEALKDVVHYIGVTTTALSDGATTNPITINGRSVTAVDGDMVFYNGTAYTWNGTAWQETLSIAQIITQIEELQDAIGNLSNLTTEEKSNLVGAINEIVADIPTKLSDLADDATHRLVTDTEKSTWDAKATTTDITNAINALDVSSVGGTGKYISAISEADGKISATAETMDTAPTEGSTKAVTSGGIKTAIDDSVSLKTATGNPVTLTDAANANAEELLMTIEPVQSGSGDPSPTNVRPISGLTSGEVTTNNGEDTNTATITFGQTVYGGSVNFKTGEVTVTHGIKKFSELSWLKSNNIFYTSAINDIKVGNLISNDFLCDYYTPVIKEWTALDNGNCVLRKGVSSSSYYSLAVRDDTYNTTSEFITAQGDRTICYELATPTTITLTPAELELLKGNNTITANGAEISIEYYPDNAIGVLAGRVEALEENKADKDEVEILEAQINSKAGNYSTSYTDFNNFPHGSIVQAYGSAAHAPGSAIHYYVVFTYFIANTTSFKLQLAIENDTGSMYTRNCINGTWGNWDTVLMDKSSSKAGNFYINRDQHPDAENNIIVKQFGKVVSINGYILGANIPSSDTSYRLGTLSNVSNPSTHIRALGTIADNEYSNGDNVYLSVSTEGHISIKTGSSVGNSKAVYFSVTYIAD